MFKANHADSDIQYANMNDENNSGATSTSGDPMPPASDAKQGRVLIIVENLPVPFDRRVWQEARALEAEGYGVSVICPKGRGYDKSYECIEGINVYRHPQTVDASGPLGYLIEYSSALFWELFLSLKVQRRHGFDVIHACNPPDLIFLVAAFHKFLFGKKFLFDHHDLSPELFEVKFGRKGLVHKVLQTFERWTFGLADVSIATNKTFKDIAVKRGKMSPNKVWVVQSFPDLKRFVRIGESERRQSKFKHLAGYVGIMGNQDGVDCLVDAMAHIVHDLNRTDIGCLIVGDGPELEPMIEKSKRLGLTDYVEFTGFLSGRELLVNLSAFDIGVIPDPPNACNDKLSMNKVFEYMALGIPFVQFDLSQAKSEAGKASLIVEEATPKGLAEGMIELVEDEARREMSRVYGMERAKREFQWEDEKKSLLAAYEEVLS